MPREADEDEIQDTENLIYRGYFGENGPGLRLVNKANSYIDLHPSERFFPEVRSAFERPPRRKPWGELVMEFEFPERRLFFDRRWKRFVALHRRIYQKELELGLCDYGLPLWLKVEPARFWRRVILAIGLGDSE